MEADMSNKVRFDKDSIKLDRFDGTNYIRWQDRMSWLLLSLNLYHLLDANLQPVAEPNDTNSDAVKKKLAEDKTKREAEEMLCRGYILNSLTDRLYDVYRNYKMPKKVWSALESKYKHLKEGTDRFLALKYFEFKFTDDMPIMDQIREMEILVSQINELQIVIPDAIQVGAILSKLPPAWNDYRRKILHSLESITIEKFIMHLQIESENRARDETLIGGSNVHHVSGKAPGNPGNSSKAQNNLKAKKKDFKNQKENKSRPYFYCGIKGHLIKDCRHRIKAEKQSGACGSGTNKANVVEGDKSDKDYVAMITEVHMAKVDQSFDWWLDSGATIHVCNNKDMFKIYKEVKEPEEVLMGNGAAAKVMGKGNVELDFTSGQKLTLANVFHVSDLKKNLVSATIMCKKGFKIVLEGNQAIVTKNNVLPVIMLNASRVSDSMHNFTGFVLQAELLRTNCKIELLHARHTLEDLELHLMDMETRSDGKLSRKEMRIVTNALDLQVKQTLFMCLKEKGLAHPEKTWYSRYLGFLFTQRTSSRRRVLAELSGEAPAPSPEASSPSPAPSPQIIPASPPLLPFFPRVNDTNVELTPANQSSDARSPNNKNNKRTVIIAVVVTASVTFMFAAFVFFCWRRCQNGRRGRNDERPLLSLSLSDYSIASSHKIFGTVNEEKLGDNQSFTNKLNPDKNTGNYHMESHSLSNSRIDVQTGNKVGPANTLVENIRPSPIGSSGASGLQPLTPPPGKTNLPPVAPPLPNNATPPPPPLPVRPTPGPPRPPPPGPPPPPVPSSLKAGPRPPPPPGPGALPPRPPPGGLKPPRPNNPSTSTSVDEGEAGASKTKLKPFFWDKVLASPNDSMVWNQIKSGSFQFDEEMIESLFGYAAAGKNRNEGKKETSQDPSTQYVKLIDPKKAQNLAIMLKALNVTTEEVCDALVEGHELPSELIQTLIKMAPTTDEELKLRVYNGELSLLGPAERFLKVLVNIPFAFKRLECLLLMCTLQEETSSLKESFAVLEAACTELRKNRLFLKLLEAVLKTGNRMNDGTFRGRAQAFKLDTLLKLADVKGTDGKTTLLHFVVQEIIRSEGKRAAKETRSMWAEDFAEDSDEQLRSLGLQVVSGLGNELENVKRAASLDQDSLTGSVASLGHQLIKARDFLNSDMKTVEAESGFSQILRSFVQNAEVDVMWLLEEEKRIMELVKSTAGYFHGNSGKDEGLRLFVIVRDFVIILDKVCREVKNAPGKPIRTEKKEETVAVSTDTRQTNITDPRERLFPAIKDRRVDSSSSDEE